MDSYCPNARKEGRRYLVILLWNVCENAKCDEYFILLLLKYLLYSNVYLIFFSWQAQKGHWVSPIAKVEFHMYVIHSLISGLLYILKDPAYRVFSETKSTCIFLILYIFKYSGIISNTLVHSSLSVFSGFLQAILTQLLTIDYHQDYITKHNIPCQSKTWRKCRYSSHCLVRVCKGSSFLKIVPR